MKNILLILVLLCSLKVVSQTKSMFFVGLKGTTSHEILSKRYSQFYGGFGFLAGVRLQREKANIDISVHYAFSSSIFAYGLKGNPYKSLLRSNLLGINLRLTFLEKDKTFRPFIQFSALTEVSTNFKNGYFLEDDFVPTNRPNENSFYSYPEYKISYYSYLYQSTPFVGSFQVGCAIRLIKDLHLNLAAGYGLRIMKTKYVEWDKNEDFHEKLKTIPTKNINSHMLDVQLGLSYTFSFKKPKESE